ncbi:hypothetical protein QP097_00700 [Oligella urethralis]|uniref:hypothetical protein n=1 Tax=Oligella TaxID=90243 RepID=UPI00069DA554|nr:MULTISPECIES: hypothetical protein [Oligella]MDK6201985.1 hypothetical protein [Oligella urethralis]OFV51574.1 hypothetical protein HMPREF3179_00015 [Oligella sp. HMSC09E12]PMC18731.1 hypothetical protein CJ230_02450 [Oligella urethralis]
MYKKIILVAAMSGLLTACQTTTSTSQQASQTQQQAQQSAITVHLAQQQAAAGLVPVTVGQGSLYALPQAVLAQSDFQGVRPVTADNGNSYLLLELNEQGRQKLATLSSQAQGHFMLLGVRGQVVSISQIRQPIQDGRLLMPTQSQQHSAGILAALRGQAQ